MPKTSMNISLPQDVKDYVEQWTRAGYSTPGEYVRELIRNDKTRREWGGIVTRTSGRAGATRLLTCAAPMLKREAFAKLGKQTRR